MAGQLLQQSAIDGIADEHRELEALYGRIRARLADKGECLKTVQALFDELVSRVRTHFATEEYGGYFREIVELAPRLSSRADRLEREHGELLAIAEQLAKDIRHACESRIWRFAIRVDFERFLHRCQEHEAAENTLVQDAYLQDIGALD